MEAVTDPVLVRRAHIARLVGWGQRLGYLLFGIAVVAFVTGWIVDFTSGLVTAIVACMVVGSIVLAPAIVFGYGVKAAERDDLEAGRDLT